MAKYDEPLLALGLLGGWGLTFEVLQNFINSSVLLISNSVVWFILSATCFYLYRQKKIYIIPTQKGKDEIVIKKSSFFYGIFLALVLTESILALVVGVLSWQTVMINGFLLFTLVDFVSIVLLVVGIVLMVSFIVILRKRLKQEKIT